MITARKSTILKGIIMPNMTTLSVTDRSDPGNDHVLLPVATHPIAWWKENGSVPLGDLTVSVSTSTSATKIKPTVRVKIPQIVEETINGVITSKVARTAYADIRLSFDVTSTSTERNELIGMVSDLFADAATQPLFHAMIVDLENAY